MNILLIGAPGCGKGTQAKKLTERKSFYHLSTGDLFRANLKQNTELGKKAKAYIEKGALAPDEITNMMTEDCLKKIPLRQGVIFDGFPRNRLQAAALDEILERSGRDLNKVIFLQADDDEIIERLTGRLWAPKSGRIYHIKHKPPKKSGFCDQSGEALIVREDDKEDIVRSRLEVFHKNTRPLLELYKERGLLKAVSGSLAPEDVFNQILKALD